MKILTLICNFLLLGFPVMALLTGNESRCTSDTVVKFFLLLVPVLNIVVLLGSQISLNKLTLRLSDRNSGDRIIKKDSKLRYLRILVIVLNIILTGLVLWVLENVHPNTTGTINILIKWFIILTPVLSLIIILISKENKFADIKRTCVIIGVSLFILLFGFFLIGNIRTIHGIRQNIAIAKEQYQGNAEESLIAFLSDTTRSFRERNEIAVWTLGQIRSEKALPVLYYYYKNDPEGKLCKGRENSMLCQYNLHKAIVNIENSWFENRERNWFGSFARLNK